MPTVTITIRIVNDALEDPGPIECSPQETVEFTGDGVGRWVVGFTDGSPFAGNTQFFSGVGNEVVGAKAKNAPANYKYWIFCEKNGEGCQACFLDPILTVRDAGGNLTASKLESFAGELDATVSRCDELATQADLLRAEALQMARLVQRSGESGG